MIAICRQSAVCSLALLSCSVVPAYADCEAERTEKIKLLSELVLMQSRDFEDDKATPSLTRLDGECYLQIEYQEYPDWYRVFVKFGAVRNAAIDKQEGYYVVFVNLNEPSLAANMKSNGEQEEAEPYDEPVEVPFTVKDWRKVEDKALDIIRKLSE